ncbi:dienelactone hydrolase family protein [Mycobacterium sherrisii]|uniref:Dienelactone hydrolase n=1 Tax=Mycobacterium sherrisii TaxID=243061 RepID=A0A1E3STX3_9MYCO|nr:dienelactone hydrolase family protein [Mycobacterium sherrisii]MCV7028840.1 dienelactone hydrolase family protein [Mycobacterium sherrisii]MEC4761749.1 dienelactone hydrolase family protein [Mycobacterium sherrisii]ODR05582.1 dienelactone hydrolase [Mycobacterium sherrisii]ORW82787.1 dienelactone hydrolase [Mycobacterium sherrisii]
MPNIIDTITTADGSCTVHLLTPNGHEARVPWPGVVMYPDAGGLRDTFQHMAAKLASYGYTVLLPDVYYRSGDWAPFDMATVFGDESERKRLFGMIGTLTPDKVASDARAFFNYLSDRPEVSGERFGVCGYCMGGRISLLVAGRVPDRVAAAASFHGGGLVTDAADSPHLLAHRMTATIYVGGAQDDASFTTDDAEQLDKALTAAQVPHTIEWYPARHGFAVPDNAPYDEAAAERHWTAMTEVFAAALPR